MARQGAATSPDLAQEVPPDHCSSLPGPQGSHGRGASVPGWYGTVPGRASRHSGGSCHHPPAIPQHTSPAPVPGCWSLRPPTEGTQGTLLRRQLAHHPAPSISRPGAFPEEFPTGCFIWRRAPLPCLGNTQQTPWRWEGGRRWLRVRMTAAQRASSPAQDRRAGPLDKRTGERDLPIPQG